MKSGRTKKSVINRPSLALSLLAASLLGVCVSPRLNCQQTQRDATASAVMTRASLMMTQSVGFQDAVVSGTVSRTGTGHDGDSGTFLLKSQLGAGSRLELQFQSERRVEIHSKEHSIRGATVSGKDAVVRPVPIHNTWIDNSWCFPPSALQAAMADPRTAMHYVGRETHDGLTVEHVRIWLEVGVGDPAVVRLVRKLSAVDLFVEATTGLLVELHYNTHPDSDAEADIPIEMRFSEYKVMSGVRLPTHIEQFRNGSKWQEFSVSDVSLNSTISNSEFQPQ